MTTTKFVLVYNAGQGPYTVDQEAGLQVLPGEFGVAQRSVVKDWVEDNQLVIIDLAAITDHSQPGAKRAKAEYERLVKEWEAEKAKDANDALPADYDDSSKKPEKKSSK